MSSKYYIGRDVMSFEDNGERLPISRVTLLLDGQTGYTSGDDTGAEFTAECYFATQEMADSILARLKGHTYKAFSAGSANLDPAAELGDGVTVGGIYSTISSLSDDGNGFPDVSAPGERELEDEYPGGSPLMRSIERSLATVRAELRVDIDSITSTVEGLEGNISKIEQRVDSITLSVSSEDGSTTFTLAADGATLSTKTLDLSVDAVNINGKLNASQLNVTGAITFEDLDSDTQDYIDAASENALGAYAAAEEAYDAAADAQDTVSGWTYGGTTYIDGSMIMTNTVRASTLEGGSVDILTASELVAGTITATGASSASMALDFYTPGGLRFTADTGDIYMESNSAYGATDLHLQSDYIAVTCAAFFGWDEADLGRSSTPWGDVYAVNSAAETSDRNLKKDIIYGLAEYDALFDKLQPVSFRFKDGTSGRRHIGMIAQDVEAALAELGIDTKDFAGFIKSPAQDKDGNIVEGEYNYALRYGEWISLNIWQIQQLKARVTELERAVYG